MHWVQYGFSRYFQLLTARNAIAQPQKQNNYGIILHSTSDELYFFKNALYQFTNRHQEKMPSQGNNLWKNSGKPDGISNFTN